MAFSCTQSVFIMYFRNLTMLKENKKTLTPPPSPLLLYNRKQLEEWQKSKGKVYKRPPMEIKAKRKVIEEMNISFWKSIEKEEEEKKAQLELSSKINKTLTECLQLIEEVSERSRLAELGLVFKLLDMFLRDSRGNIAYTPK